MSLSGSGVPAGRNTTNTLLVVLLMLLVTSSVDSSYSPAPPYGSATLDFPLTIALTCSDLTIVVTGAVVGDKLAIGLPPAAIVTGGTFTWWVSSSNTVTIRFCALVLGDPSSGTFNAVVVR